MRFVFNDYETFNLSPLGGAASQYAAIKTDENLKRLSAENFFCLPSADLTPEYQACLVTKQTPDSIRIEKNAFAEYDFVSKIHDLITSSHDTVVVGYNSLKFDDEWHRHLFYRNLYPAYDWHFKNGNSRYDAMLLMQAVYALRPHLLKWHSVPISSGSEQTRVSMKLAHLSRANDVIHDKAHDALSDVDALISLMQKIKLSDPEFFDLALSVRDKWYIQALLTSEESQLGLFHISPYDREHHFIGYIIPLFASSEDKNVYWAWDAKISPETILSLPEETKRNLLSLKKDDMERLGLDRKGLVKIKLNQLPNLFPNSCYHEDVAGENPLIHIKAQMKANTELVFKKMDEIKALIHCVETNSKTHDDLTDYDMRLYRDGFMDFDEKHFAQTFHSITDWDERYQFTSVNAPTKRTKELAMRVIGRNSPGSFMGDDRAHWDQYIAKRMSGLVDNAVTIDGTPLTARNQIDTLFNRKNASAFSDGDMQIITEIIEYYQRHL
ncbi:exodeoxyribonuclease I [Photobacterium galatheae]|uniref:Exodeoxyribonuclease I n=1 Tax=Photobacterium galatheae TaxID=1654360 RepID=A0A066RT99_9GAMM|nr:exodeoxyribonuclease I [Photobacterium galatheae]KDM90927.1 hypothetical protein EA58_14300 [Photobacterium galatheae]MCM0149109.1 exodeoxyribonuclease I [Photobacterium galatheae]